MEVFDPVKYSREENLFLLENVGKAPIVALNGLSKEGVNPRAVRPVLQEVYDREQLRAQSGVEWAGVEKVREKISDFITLDEKWEKDWVNSRGRIPRFPSMYTKDGKGKYHWGGPGSDSDHPKTYVKSGTVQTFELDLNGVEDSFVEETLTLVSPTLSLIHDEKKCRLECPICNHTESYKTESRSSYNAARARMSKHLAKATDEQSLHRELYTVEFGA